MASMINPAKKQQIKGEKMKTTLRILMLFLFLLILGGCVSKHYRVTPEVYREQVKVLGVLPLMVDTESTILHPQRQEIFDILQQSSSEKYLRLSAHLGANAGYREVRPVIIDAPSQLQLLAGKGLKSGQDGTYRRYQPAPAAVSELARTAGVDGLLIVILNGVENKGKRWEGRGGPRYLEAEFNEIQATAMVLGANGEVLWEKSGASGGPFVDLQYVDFAEAYHNRTDEVTVRFITPDGLRRELQASAKGLFEKEPFSTRYRTLFESLSDGLTVGKIWRQ
jgi:hypothetical protein